MWLIGMWLIERLQSINVRDRWKINSVAPATAVKQGE
ncbi:hypothetical protein X757_22505 [Mesorhizobium sp. LSHC414A00]|nr:hypothetical protein X757_22505 [Mesorhizobium sp. LSHC414A00]